MDTQLRAVFVANGVQAQQVLAFLEAAGIAAVRRNTHGLTVDGLGAVEILRQRFECRSVSSR